MRELSWAETVRRVHQRADNRCEYCQTAQRVMGQAMHVEHIHLVVQMRWKTSACPARAVI